MNDHPTLIEWTSRRTADGLRMRYRPACRINHAFFTVAPWLDTLLLGVCVILALSSRAVVPGVVIDLPAAPFHEGLSSDLVLVVNPLPTASGESATKSDVSSGGVAAVLPIMVFFNDDRFNLSTDRQTLQLQEAMVRHLERVGARDALLYVDRRVAHGDVMALVTLLRTTGVRRANVAVKTP